jgi:hypothetical protein
MVHARGMPGAAFSWLTTQRHSIDCCACRRRIDDYLQAMLQHQDEYKSVQCVLVAWLLTRGWAVNGYPSFRELLGEIEVSTARVHRPCYCAACASA